MTEAAICVAFLLSGLLWFLVGVRVGARRAERELQSLLAADIVAKEISNLVPRVGRKS